MNLVGIASAATLLLPVVCHATLGAAPSTDAHQTSSRLRATPLSASPIASAWSVQESQTADGVTVREYASPANGVRPMPPVCNRSERLTGRAAYGLAHGLPIMGSPYGHRLLPTGGAAR
ncbi:DUF2844 domain-containing protein [Paraburkholderia phymatum]|uniref:DUF2844 domain-containing protein n=1 Tax=Paraburkholderia phymatum TaxID=148447 RepID=A0ACC6TUT0_9BURK